MSKSIDHPQGSEEWLQARCGLVTASNFATVMGKGKTRESYLYKLAAERITGTVVETYKNDAMLRGTELEPEARNNYEFEKNATVEETSLWIDGEVGASPDGLVGDDGIIEIKCPLPHTHVSYLDKQKLPAIYKAQVHGQLWVTERKWCDFMSYHPEMKSMIIRVERDEDYIKDIALKVAEFNEQLNELVERIK